MMNLALVVTTFNSGSYINKLLDSIVAQNRNDIMVFVSDDGSKDDTLERLYNFKGSYVNCEVIPLPHKERGYARSKAIKKALEANLEYIMIIDADMILEDNLIDECMMTMNQDPRIGGLVIKEIPFSEYRNTMTKVKLFERTVLNNSSRKLDFNSIEAARFWRRKAYIESGGINPKQIAFEETQPTIRYIKSGGTIFKHMGSGMFHDEKHVTLKNILEKKKYHFKMMDKTFETEKDGLLKALKRWYFFRPVMYKKCNLKLYIKHPLLTIGMINMYMILTIIGCMQMLSNKLAKEV